MPPRAAAPCSVDTGMSDALRRLNECPAV